MKRKIIGIGLVAGWAVVMSMPMVAGSHSAHNDKITALYYHADW